MAHDRDYWTPNEMTREELYDLRSSPGGYELALAYIVSVGLMEIFEESPQQGEILHFLVKDED